MYVNTQPEVQNLEKQEVCFRDSVTGHGAHEAISLSSYVQTSSRVS